VCVLTNLRTDRRCAQPGRGDTTAKWSGSGKLNGEDGYTFEATVVDNRNGNAAKKGDPDTVAITVYDGEGAEVWSLSATDLTRGNITVHTEE
jgi:hypothetical protein